ncbi:MAG: TldD/PmbA family protein [Pseudomonadota bacterium]
MKNLNELAGRALDMALKAGADSADVLVADGQTLSIEVRAGELEHADRSEGLDVGLRVLVGARQASMSVSDTSDNALREMAARAVAMAQEAPDDPYAGLADPASLAQNWNTEALELADTADHPNPAGLKQLALEAEAAALAVDGITQSQGAGAGMSDTHIWLAATNGFSGGYRKTTTSVSCVAISGEGLSMERDYAGEARAFQSDLPPASEIGTLAGERAVARSGATKPKTGTYPVLFDERISSSLIGHLLAAMNGAAISRGSSFLKDKLGQKILPIGLSVVEDPARPRAAGSRPFDGEGLPVQKRAWIEDGVLVEWIMDLATARKLGRSSTGNAGRGMSSPPSPSVGNVALTEGSKTKEQLLSDMGTGLWVTSMIGSTINPNTGDYSRGISGFWVENGEVKGPVNEATIAGNLLDFMMRIVPANDARPHLSRVVPSLLVEGLTIAGD